MTAVRIVAVPYDSGHRNERMGAGPLHLLQSGFAENLQGQSHTVAVEVIEAGPGFRTEVTTAFELMRKVGARVEYARDANEFPFILSGNCSIAVGTVSGINTGKSDLGVIWFDAHGDMETPDTTTSGFFDGTGLSIIAGQSWHALAASVPNFSAISPEKILLAGQNDLSEGERSRCSKLGVQLLEGSQLEKGASEIDSFLDRLHRGGVRRVYLHIDLDVHHKKYSPVNSYQGDSGIRPELLRQCVSRIASRFTISACALSAYDPQSDPDSLTVEVAGLLAKEIVDGL
jgi:arginase